MFKSKPSSSHYLYGASVLVVVGLFIFATNNQTKIDGPSPYDVFAQCLSSEGVKMYGAWWCSHCNNQKEMFESAFSYINYVECSTVAKTITDECKEIGIKGFPSWTLSDGTILDGEQSLETLSEQTGCTLPLVE